MQAETVSIIHDFYWNILRPTLIILIAMGLGYIALKSSGQDLGTWIRTLFHELAKLGKFKWDSQSLNMLLMILAFMLTFAFSSKFEIPLLGGASESGTLSWFENFISTIVLFFAFCLASLLCVKLTMPRT